LAVAVLGEVLGRIAGAYIDRSNDEMEDRFMKRAMTLADLRRMDSDNDARISPSEFLQYMLVALQKVEKEEIDEIMQLFKTLDKSNTGFIDKEDLMSNYNLALRPGVAVTASNLQSTFN
jgi:Ca2+-binding EF-hand superfamily protein